MTAGGFTFTKATKANRKLRLALAGPAGSGKTMSALLMAQELAQGGDIAVIDTERETASLYSDLVPFDALNVHDFNPELLPKMLAAAAAARYAVVIVDGMSAFWSGTGGMLEQVDNAGRRSMGGNGFGGWKEMRPVERAMIDALLSYPGHVIVTMRVKTEYIVEENERGKKVPRKVGLQPEQRGGIEYEFDVVGDMDLEHTMTVSKSRCSVVADAVIRKPGGEFAITLLDWLQSGVTTQDALDYLAKATASDLTFDGAKQLYMEVKGRGLLNAAVPNDRGVPSTLGEIILDHGRAARIAEEAAARALTDAEHQEQAAQADAAARAAAEAAFSDGTGDDTDARREASLQRQAELAGTTS